MKLKYVGTEPSGIRIGDKEILPGDEFEADESTANYLSSFTNFEKLTEEDKPKKKVKEK